MAAFKKAQLKCGGGAFTPLPRVCLQSKSFARLSPHGLKLLFDLMAQYKGFNNGDLSAAWKLMEERGWRSRDTLGKALTELLTGGWIIKTRQGGMHRCSLFALTLFFVDECKDKHGHSKYDAHIKPTHSPPGGWYRESTTLSVPCKRIPRSTPADGDYKGTRQAC